MNKVGGKTFHFIALTFILSVLNGGTPSHTNERENVLSL